MTEADVVELWQSPGPDLSSEAPMGLGQEHAAGEECEGGSPVLRQFRARPLAMALAHCDAGLQTISGKDPNPEHSLRVCRGMNNMVSCYRELLKEKRGPKWWWWW